VARRPNQFAQRRLDKLSCRFSYLCWNLTRSGQIARFHFDEAMKPSRKVVSLSAWAVEAQRQFLNEVQSRGISSSRGTRGIVARRAFSRSTASACPSEALGFASGFLALPVCSLRSQVLQQRSSHAGFPFLVFFPLAIASVSSSFFVCADSAGIRARRASSESRK
jgi:hypothetical protein